MPRREESDIRAGRFESELRTSEFKKLKTSETGRIQARVFACSSCGKAFAERSRYCPRCDTKTMGELKPHRESEAERYRAQSIERLRAKYRG